MKINRHTVITVGILAGLILGAIVGQALFIGYDKQVPDEVLGGLKFVGDTFFIGLLKMVLVPLVASSVIVGVASIGDPSHLGKVGGWTVFYYFSTMLIAVLIGLTLVTSIAPGEGIGEQVINQGEAAFEVSSAKSSVEGASEKDIWFAMGNIIQQMIPRNPIGAAADGQMLPVISFSVIFGIVLTVIGERGKTVIDFFDGVFAAIMQLVEWILWLAPIGVFCLVAWTVARLGGEELLKPLATYMITVVAGLSIHAFIVLPLILLLIGRTNPFRYMHQMREALMTAFGTDSSSATLPVTMDCAERHGGVSKRASGFVLPLGATINMDGTALYEAVAVVFLFQVYGIELGPTELGIIAITATLAAVGAAGIPSAGLVTMVIVVEAVNNSLGLAKGEGLPLASVGIIIGVDRILDMCRTTVNVWGDAVGAKLITRIAPDAPAT
jgi:Na+/H+-dicarboxylate symporter